MTVVFLQSANRKQNSVECAMSVVLPKGANRKESRRKQSLECALTNRNQSCHRKHVPRLWCCSEAATQNKVVTEHRPWNVP